MSLLELVHQVYGNTEKDLLEGEFVTSVQRLGVYYLKDPCGVVDDYALYYLTQLMDLTTDTFVFVADVISEEDRHKLECLETQVVTLPASHASDHWLIGLGLAEIGWRAIRNYDQLILTDSSSFGPFSPLASIFEVMAQRKSDFWGLTNFPALPRWKLFPKDSFIQDYFIVFNKLVLQSHGFESYWREQSRRSTADGSERLSKHLRHLGFESSTYLPLSLNQGKISQDATIFWPKGLIDNGFPVLRVEAITSAEVSRQTDRMDVRALVSNLDEMFGYDSQLVWQHVLRVAHSCDLGYNLGWNHIISERAVAGRTSSVCTGEIALVMHLHYPQLVGDYLEYIKHMPLGCDVHITTSQEEVHNLILGKLEQFSNDYNISIYKVENRGRCESALLVQMGRLISKYKYVCFLHDKDSEGRESNSVWRENFQDHCLKCVVFSPAYVEEVIALFENDSRLGMLSPPPQNFGDFSWKKHGWGPNYRNTQELAERLKLKVPMSPRKLPMAPFGTCFWFRPSAMKPLLDHGWKYEDFPEEPVSSIDGTLLHAIERIYPFIVQHAGYHPAWVQPDEVASYYGCPRPISLNRPQQFYAVVRHHLRPHFLRLAKLVNN